MVVILLALRSESVAQNSEKHVTLFDDDLLSEYFDEFTGFLNDDRIVNAVDVYNDVWLDEKSRPINLRNISRRALSYISSLNDLDISKLLSRTRTSSSIIDTSITLLLDPRSSELSRQQMNRKRRDRLEIRSRMFIDPNASDENEYASHIYQGSAIKTATKIRYSGEDFKLGIVQAKDAGEPLFFDRIGASFSLAHPINISPSLSAGQFILGDYSLSFGEGLILGSGLFHGKSADAIGPAAMRSTGIVPYLSSADYQYFRGAASHISLGIISLDVFYSDRNVDATIPEFDSVTSLYVSGYHRSTNEIARRGVLHQELGGSRIGFSLFESDSTFLRFGAIGYALNYAESVVNSDSLNTRFSGRTLNSFSFDASALFANILLRGEFAHSRSDAANANAFIITTLSRPFDAIDLSINYRYIPENFLSPFGTVFGDNASDAQNERGLYVGVRRSLIDRILSIEGYVDLSSRTERTRFATIFPATRDARIAVTYLPNSDRSLKFSADVRLRRRESSLDDTAGHFSFLQAKSLLSGKVFASYFIVDECELAAKISTRILTNANPKESGIAATFIARYYPLDELRIESGISYYNSDSYDTRLFLSESEVYSSSTLVALYGEGNRYYVLSAYNFQDRFRLTAKVAESAYTDNSLAKNKRITLSLEAQIRL